MKATGNHFRAIHTSISRLGKFILPWGHWCWQAPFWNPPPWFISTGTWPHPPASQHQSWDTQGQGTGWVETEPRPPAGNRTPFSPIYSMTWPHLPEGQVLAPPTSGLALALGASPWVSKHQNEDPWALCHQQVDTSPRTTSSQNHPAKAESKRGLPMRRPVATQDHDHLPTITLPTSKLKLPLYPQPLQPVTSSKLHPQVGQH